MSTTEVDNSAFFSVTLVILFSIFVLVRPFLYIFSRKKVLISLTDTDFLLLFYDNKQLTVHEAVKRINEMYTLFPSYEETADALNILVKSGVIQKNEVVLVMENDFAARDAVPEKIIYYSRPF